MLGCLEFFKRKFWGQIFEIFSTCMYTPPLLKNVTGEYLGFNHFYPKAKLKIWSLSNSILAWGAKLMHGHKTLIKFDFIKNKNKDYVKKMPIHTLKIWAHELAMVIIMLEDPCMKQVVGLVYSIDIINNELSQTSADKGFKFKNMKAKTI